MTASWDVVYSYDVEFRRHMARHPLRSWGIILQQAWNIYLRDRGNVDSNGNRGGGHQETQSFSNCGGGRKKEVCWRYNRGRCSFGGNCKFDHRCGICGKFGHGGSVCRRLQSNDRNNNYNNNSGGNPSQDRQNGGGGNNSNKSNTGFRKPVQEKDEQ